MSAWQPTSATCSSPPGEHAFQTAKAQTAAEHERIRVARAPMVAKQVGRRVALPRAWSTRRAHVILTVLRAKFANGELPELLLSTGDAILPKTLRMTRSGPVATAPATTPGRTSSGARGCASATNLIGPRQRSPTAAQGSAPCQPRLT
jgi:hypothetical protein